MTRANPKLTLTKDHLQKTKRGNVRKYKAATNAREGEQVPSPPTDEQLAALGIAAVPTPPSTPPLNFTGRLPGKPITRRGVPTCLDYGSHRRILYPGSLFCSPCDWYEQEVMLHNHNRISCKKGSRYGCQCDHVSFSEPAGSECVPSPTSTSANSKVTILPTRHKLYDPKILLKTGSLSSLDNSDNTSTSTDNCDEEAEPNEKMNIPEINVSDADNEDSKPKALSPLESVKRNLLYNASLVVCEPVLLSHEETHVRLESYARAVTNSMTSHHKCTPTITESCGSFVPSQNSHTNVIEHKPLPESMLSAANTPEIDSQQASFTSHQDRTSSITTHLQQSLCKPSLNNAEEQDESPRTNSTTYINNEAVYAAAVAAVQAPDKDEKIIKLQQSLKRANKHIENLTIK